MYAQMAGLLSSDMNFLRARGVIRTSPLDKSVTVSTAVSMTVSDDASGHRIVL